MSITKILADKNTTDAAKLEAVAETVAAARKAYGNTEDTITVPDVNTAMGSIGFSDLLEDSKVTLLQAEALRIRVRAVEAARNIEGLNVSKKIEELLATNPMFTNIASTSAMSYI